MSGLLDLCEEQAAQFIGSEDPVRVEPVEVGSRGVLSRGNPEDDPT